MNIKKKHILSAAAFLTAGTLVFSTGFTAAPTPAPSQKASTSKSSAPIRPGNFGTRQTDLKPILDKLVKAKTITAAQETKIIAYQKKQDAAQQAEMAKIQKMTQAQRDAYFKKQNGTNKPGQRQNQFAALVKNKTITQKQADAIEKAISASRPARPNGQNPPGINQSSQKNN